MQKAKEREMRQREKRKQQEREMEERNRKAGKSALVGPGKCDFSSGPSALGSRADTPSLKQARTR